jgi:HEAT repeat protein
MDKLTRTHLDNIRSKDKELQNKAYFYILNITVKPVDWAYDVWDEMVAGLTHNDNHVRAIAAQVLCNLAKSDPKERILKDFDRLLEVTRDERFVTARHCMQSLWKVGVVGKKQQKIYMDGLERRFKECITDKNCTLIRYDILQSMRNVYDTGKDEKIKEKAFELIEAEEDPKYRKKYAGLWKEG